MERAMQRAVEMRMATHPGPEFDRQLERMEDQLVRLERQHRLPRVVQCYRCGSPDHLVMACPLSRRSRGPRLGAHQLPPARPWQIRPLMTKKVRPTPGFMASLPPGHWVSPQQRRRRRRRPRRPRHRRRRRSRVKPVHAQVSEVIPAEDSTSDPWNPRPLPQRPPRSPRRRPDRLEPGLVWDLSDYVMEPAPIRTAETPPPERPEPELVWDLPDYESAPIQTAEPPPPETQTARASDDQGHRDPSRTGPAWHHARFLAPADVPDPIPVRRSSRSRRQPERLNEALEVFV